MTKKSLPKDDGVHGALLMVHYQKLSPITRDEIEEAIQDWRAKKGEPPELTSRDQIFQYSGPEFSQFDLSGTDLSDLDLRFIKLMHCDLSGARLNNTDLGGASLFGCDLSDVISWNGQFRCSSIRQCYIVNSTFMHARFEGASFAHSNIENTRMINSNHDRDTWFFQTRLFKVNLQAAQLEKVNLKETRTVFGCKLHHARLDGTEIDFSLFGGKIGEELERDYVKAAETYSAIKANLEAAGLYNQAARAYVKERQMEKEANAPWNTRRLYGASELDDVYEYSQELNKYIRTKIGATWKNPRTWQFHIRHTLKWISDWFVELLCSYGESVWRVVVWMELTVFIIGPVIISLAGGLVWPDETLQIYRELSSPFNKWAYTYFQHILYMIDTFTTADFALLEPANDLVRLVSGLMAMLGIFLAGLLGFVAGNRIRFS